MLNSNGPKIEPCRTPAKMLVQSLNDPFTFGIYYIGDPALIFDSNKLWFTASKALERSIKIAPFQSPLTRLSPDFCYF